MMCHLNRSLEKKTFPAGLLTAGLLVCLVIGAVMTLQYGSYWDMQTENKILFMNIAQYFKDLPFLSEKAPKLAETFLNYGLIKDSVEIDHGCAPYYPVAAALALSAGRMRYMIWCFYTYFIFSVGCVSLFMIARRLFQSLSIAFALFLLYFLSPVVFAAGHYNNKDMTFASLCLLVFWLGIRYRERLNLTGGILFSLAAALATNVKIIGVFLWGLLLLFAFLRFLTDESKRHLSVLLGGVVCAIAFFGFYYLITPAAYGDVIAFARYLIRNAGSFARWNGDILFDGMVYNLTDNPLPWYYLPKMIFVTTPLITDLLIIGSVLFFIAAVCRRIIRREKLDDRQETLLVSFVFWASLLLYAMFSHMVVYNAWRHFTFVYGFMILLCGYPLAYFSETKVTEKNALKVRICRIMFGVFCIYLSLIILIGHPFQYAYTNFLFSNHADSRYELDYWNLSIEPALEKLYSDTARNKTLALTVMDYHNKGTLNASVHVLPDEIREKFKYVKKDANYYIVPVTYYAIAQTAEKKSTERPEIDGYHYLDGISAYGNELVWIYEKD